MSSSIFQVWSLPEGNFERNIEGQLQTNKPGAPPPSLGQIINCAVMKPPTDPASSGSGDVLIAGTDDGVLNFIDYKTGYCYQTIQTPPQPGSLAQAENGIFAMAMDKSASRLITAECDKTIKIYKEIDDVTAGDEDDGGEIRNDLVAFKPTKRARY
jgi:pleiotropic regulator 1